MTENDVDTEDSKEETDTRPIILAVEDNDDIREYIASSFHANYQVITAINGKEGWELAQKYIPNIIISDIMMPVMDGIEALSLHKGRYAHQSYPCNPADSQRFHSGQRRRLR
ncbi:response regulator [Bacteroides thetaiotaomicron]|nr:response regulator [Bacteroides thetaiotaomicron]